MPDEPIVIAGAGIAGLALAAALRRHGRDSVVFEERPRVFATGGGITLWPNALAALDAIGLGSAVRRAGFAVSTGSMRTPSGRVLTSIDPDRVERALGGPLVAIRRGDLLDILQEDLAPGSIRTGVAVRGFAHTSGGVEVALVDGSRVTAPALVGADGYRSEVARGIGALPITGDSGALQLASGGPESPVFGALRQRYAGYPAWRAIAPLTDVPALQIVGERKEFGLVPLGDHGTYWYATLQEPPDGTAPGGELTHLRRHFAGWPDPVTAALEATAEDAVSRVDILDRASPARWHDGPVAVIGDAAHPMRPHLGQGGCQALVDVAVLAPLLADGRDPAAAFAAYVAARRRPAMRAVLLSRQVGRVLNAPFPLHRLMPLVPDSVFLRRLASLAGASAFQAR